MKPQHTVELNNRASMLKRPPRQYLENSRHIDWQHSEITAQAAVLARGLSSKQAIANACFEFVRDKIRHSWDFQDNPVTCKASDVLKHGTGYCYAKSHLLAALLRANKIPAGLCYQRLATGEATAPFCLHGLNAVYLENYGWYRLDARGNKTNIEAQFNPPVEKLAYKATVSGETDLPEIYARPLECVTAVLTIARDYQEVNNNLPDSPFVDA